MKLLLKSDYSTGPLCAPVAEASLVSCGFKVMLLLGRQTVSLHSEQRQTCHKMQPTGKH